MQLEVVFKVKVWDKNWNNENKTFYVGLFILLRFLRGNQREIAHEIWLHIMDDHWLSVV